VESGGGDTAITIPVIRLHRYVETSIANGYLASSE